LPGARTDYEKYGGNCEHDCGVEQASRELSQLSGQGNKAPIKIRLFLALLALFGQLGLSFWGWQNIDSDRRLRGCLLLGIGGLLGSFRQSLFLLT
jgi:hypothetical protein